MTDLQAGISKQRRVTIAINSRKEGKANLGRINYSGILIKKPAEVIGCKCS